MADRETMPIMGGVLLKAIPWALIGAHEGQAQSNHSQTLNRLAERGGLGPSEALAIIADRGWFAGRPYSEEACERALMWLIVGLKGAEAKAA